MVNILAVAIYSNFCNADSGYEVYLDVDVPDSDADFNLSYDEDDEAACGGQDGCRDVPIWNAFVNSDAPQASDNYLPAGWVHYQYTKKQATHRDAFEKIKAALCLSDEDTTKMLKIWKNMKPVEDWDNFVTDGRLLARPALRHLRGIAPRRVVCGLKKTDLVPYIPVAKRDAMLLRYQQTGCTVDPTGRPKGDCIDFDLEKCLLLQSPGNLNPKGYLKFLKRVHAARPNLLSEDFVRLVDPQLYAREKLEHNDLRSKMNYFELKWHTDGIQIAKNSTSAEGKPISFMIDSICPYDPDKKQIITDEKHALRIPPSLTTVMTITVYHGRGKCCQFQFSEFWKNEEWRLSVKNDDALVLKSRRLVVGSLLTIADAPERSLNLGKLNTTSANH